MEILRRASDLLSSNMYVIVEGGHAIVIDPHRSLEAVQGLTVDKILLTHEHYDHISGVNLYREQGAGPVLCSRACGESITDARKNMASLFEVFCQLQTWVKLDRMPEADEHYVCRADETFEDTFAFDWEGHSFQLFALPGHSQGSIGILLDGDRFFSGDSLMENSDTELRLPGGSRRQWAAVSLPRLAALPDGIRVYPGHFGDFQLDREGRRLRGFSV